MEIALNRLGNKQLALIGTASVALGIVILWAVAYVALLQRSTDAVAESQKYLSVRAATVARLVPVVGTSAIPSPSEIKVFKTYDVYLTNAEGKFLTTPRFAAVGAFSSPDRYNAAWDKGVALTGEWLDYRGVPVVGAVCQTLLNGKRAVVVVEIDRSEVAEIAWKPWYLLREVGVPAFVLLSGFCGLLLFRRAEEGRIAKAVSSEGGIDYGRFFNQFVRLFPDGGLILVDADGKIVECNTEFAKMDGKLSARDLIGTPIHRFHPDPEAHKGLFASFSEDLSLRPVTALLDGKPTNIFLSVTRFNGWFVARITFRNDKAR